MTNELFQRLNNPILENAGLTLNLWLEGLQHSLKLGVEHSMITLLYSILGQ